VRPVGLRTRRLVLDEPMPYDAEAVTRYCQDPLFEQYLTTPWPYSRADADAFLGVHVPESWATGAELTWALRLAHGGRLLGVISVRSGEHEIGYWMGAEHRGAGYMSEAAIAVVDWALGGGIRHATSLRWRAIEGNVASAKVARAAGFRRVHPEDATLPTRDGRGRLPAWHAVRTAPADPAAFASWTDILGEAA
jgi:RimJ/RimL family protein N-acetyltransferase